MDVKWYHKNGRLPANAKSLRSFSIIDNYLLINSTTFDNAGTYQCHGKDIKSQVYFTAEGILTVSGE